MNVGRAGEQRAYSCFIVPNEIQSNCVRKALIIFMIIHYGGVYMRNTVYNITIFRKMSSVVYRKSW
jgi:hypothetical protein